MTVFRRGITLLEVILSLAILAGAMVMIGELLRIGGRHATAATVISKGQLHCQSVMAQLDAGLLMLSPVQNVSIPNDLEWMYSIDVQPQQLNGLVAVSVMAMRQGDQSAQPIHARLTKWMVDPAFVQQRVDAAVAAAEEQAGAGR